MVALGAEIAAAIEPGTVIHLVGELGMGKTTLSRGVIQALGHKGAVKSPTYTLVEPYEHTRMRAYHFDLYRLGDPDELEFMGIRDYLDGESLCLVEWPQRGAGILPPADLVITIEKEGSGRSVELRANAARGEAVVDRMKGKS